MEETYSRLVERLGEVQDIVGSAWVLGWDQRTKMPPAGATARADQLSTLTRLAFERFTADEIGTLLEELRPYEESLEYDSLEASLIRVTRRDYAKARRVPLELRAETARAAVLAEGVWREARQRSDFGLFLPHLERAIELKEQYIECFQPVDEPYDALLDDYEPGMKTAEVRAVFKELRDGLVPLVAEIAERSDAVDDSALTGDFPLDRQQRVEQEILHAFGLVDDEWRVDETAHPFASKGGPQDVRLTTHHHADNLTSLFACMHEFGHGLYEYQVDRALYRTPLGRGASLGVHESQSRMWENMIGRSLPFWERFFPLVRDAFPDRLGGLDAEGFYRAVNRVRPSLIRIHADEVTYNLHIILRFELEQELVSGQLAPADASEAWNARVEQYLGIGVPDVADGVLQDMHWSGGAIGYFPTYALGNVISAQLWERIGRELPALDDQVRAGELGQLREWLGQNVHRHGRKYLPRELLERTVGGGLDPQPLLRYLRTKFGAIYGLQHGGNGRFPP
jgi:carboxypeptidase Taq